MFAERVALWHKSSSFPSFASLSVNVVKGILAVIPTAGLGMNYLEDTRTCTAQLMMVSEPSCS